MTSTSTLSPEPLAAEPVAEPRPAIRWVELICLLCGELAGRIEDERIVRPAAPGSVRLEGQRLLCGRCGSSVLPGERGEGTPFSR